MFRKQVLTQQRLVSEYGNKLIFVLQLQSELFNNNINLNIVIP